MEIRVLDFDILTKNYKNYQDGIKNIAGEKNQFISKPVSYTHLTLPTTPYV